VATTSLPRASNRSAVLAELLSGTEMDRQQLIAGTGLSRATVFRIVDDLMENGLVAERHRILRDGPGRQSTAVAFNDRSALVCGVDLGGTNCRTVLCDALGRPVVRSHRATPTGMPAEELAQWLAEEIRVLAGKHGDGVPLRAVTVGLPGVVTGDGRNVVNSHNLGQIRGTTFIDLLSGLLDPPTVIANDSNLALRGELQYGTLPETETAVLLTLGTGLGSAVSLGGRILAGESGLLGEFGRLRLPGRPHRLRDFLSGAGLAAYARERGVAVGSARDVFTPGTGGAEHQALLREVDEALTHLVSLVALAYEPRTVLLTGGLSDSFDTSCLDRVADEVARTVGVRSTVRKSQLGQSAGLLGAVASSLATLYASLGVSSAHIASIQVDRELITSRLVSCPIDQSRR
jgi:predicted NBD/HSP70 family sugar kinase